MKTALVTGGAGFIGSHLARSLVQTGVAVRVLDDLSTGNAHNLADVADRIQFIPGDVRDLSADAAAVQGVDVVFHLAAMVSVPLSVKEPERCHAICATGTLKVLEAAAAAGVRRVVYAGSSSAYGDAGQGAIAESAPLRPMSPYAAAKLAGEHYCQAWSAVSNLETVRLRFFNVFGPNQDPSSPYSGVISIFTKLAREGGAPTIYGDGLQTRDFVYVGDVVRALRLAAETPGVNGEVFNIGRGHAVTLLELLSEVGAAAGVKLAPQFAPPRTGDIKHSLADVAAARHRLGFAAEVALVDGLKRCLDAVDHGAPSKTP
jgi:Nucleoside-diphosphate-sugar epimerases